jgi:cell division protein FtsL
MAEAIYKPIELSASEREQDAGSPSKRVNRDLVFVALLGALALIGSSLFDVWAHNQEISLGYEISQASQEEQTLLKENQKLRLELAALKSPRRIENIALKELGFVNPQKEQLIIVR